MSCLHARGEKWNAFSTKPQAGATRQGGHVHRVAAMVADGLRQAAPLLRVPPVRGTLEPSTRCGTSMPSVCEHDHHPADLDRSETKLADAPEALSTVRKKWSQPLLQVEPLARLTAAGTAADTGDTLWTAES